MTADNAKGSITRTSKIVADLGFVFSRLNIVSASRKPIGSDSIIVIIAYPTEDLRDW